MQPIVAIRKAALLGLLLPLAQAHAQGFPDEARVLDVRPLMRQVNEPRRECREEYPADTRSGSGGNGTAGAVIGGVAGALLGHTVGRGSGKQAATAAGAIGGAIVGNRLGSRDDDSDAAPRRECRTVDNWVDRPDGYDVRYEYRGHEFRTNLPYDPGQRLRVRVDVQPVS